MRELDILRMVNHERVILLHEVYESKDHVNLVFDFLRAGDLHKRVSKVGAYSELQALSIIRQILEGLSHLHSRGIIHRDLKLDNVFLE
jgi:serine/threonine protein kinase